MRRTSSAPSSRSASAHTAAICSRHCMDRAYELCTTAEARQSRPHAARLCPGRTRQSGRNRAGRFDTDIEKQGAPPMAEPAFQPSVFDRLLKDRIIWLGSEVRDDNANEIAAKLLLLAAEDPERDIYLYINSPGGSITAGMAIYDTMQFIPNDVVTVGIGMAASMGQLLL